MHISMFLRQLFLFLTILFIFNTSLSIAQPYHAAQVIHPDGQFGIITLNNIGQIAGFFIDTTGIYHAVRRETDGQFTRMTELESNVSVAYGMNELGQILGLVLNESFVWLPVVWEGTEIRELDLIENVNAIIPVDVNINGIATGYILDTTWTSRPIVWDASGAVQYLPDLDAVAGIPAAINDKGEIVGTLFNQDNWSRAVLWEPDGDSYTAIDLGTLGGLFAQATDINNYSQIVGLASLEEAGYFAHAVFWDNLEIFDLGTIGGDNSIATGINDDGFIVGAAQDTASGIPALISGSKWKDWQANFSKLHKGNKYSPPFIHSLSYRSPDDLAFTTMIRMDDEMRNFTPGLKTFTGRVDIDEELNDAIAPNLSRSVLGYSAATEHIYLLQNFQFRYLDNEATEPGFPGRADRPYILPNTALTDFNLNITRFNLFAKPGSNFGNLNSQSGTRVTVNSYTGFGSTLKHEISGSSTTIGDIIVSLGSSLKFSHKGFGTVETERVEVSGRLLARENIFFNVFEKISMNGENAYAKSHFVTGPSATISLNKGYLDGMVFTNNSDFETDLIGRNNAAPGTGVIEGGSRFSSIPGILCRPVSSATGENGGYAFAVSVPANFKYTPVFVFRNEDPIEPVNVVIKAEPPDAEPILNLNNVNVGDILFDAIRARYEVKAEPVKGNNKTTSQQIFTATFRVAVDSINLSEDPNLFRLLQFGFDGEYIGVAGTFVPPSGSPPTTAIYTGFIESMLNVTHHDVTITDSVILVLASGDVQTDIPSFDETDIITTFELAQNFPNPFNPETVIQYQIPHNSKVRLIVYNILGQPVRTLVNGERSTGVYNQEWDMISDNGQMVSSGIYMYRIEAKSENGESYIKTRKMVVLR